MEIRTLYCDSCKEKIDETNLLEARMLKKNELTNYYFDKRNSREAKYLTSGNVCKKCAKKIDKRLKELFKEFNFICDWKDKED